VSAQPKVCGICSDVSHPMYTCPTLQEENNNDHTVAVVGVFPLRPQQHYNPYSKTYNPGCRDHPNMRWDEVKIKISIISPQIPPSNQGKIGKRILANTNLHSNSNPHHLPHHPPNKGGSSLEDLMKQMTTNNLQFQQKTKVAIQSLQTQIR